MSQSQVLPSTNPYFYLFNPYFLPPAYNPNFNLTNLTTSLPSTSTTSTSVGGTTTTTSLPSLFPTFPLTSLPSTSTTNSTLLTQFPLLSLPLFNTTATNNTTTTNNSNGLLNLGTTTTLPTPSLTTTSSTTTTPLEGNNNNNNNSTTTNATTTTTTTNPLSSLLKNNNTSTVNNTAWKKFSFSSPQLQEFFERNFPTEASLVEINHTKLKALCMIHDIDSAEVLKFRRRIQNKFYQKSSRERRRANELKKQALKDENLISSSSSVVSDEVDETISNHSMTDVLDTEVPTTTSIVKIENVKSENFDN